MPERSPRTAAVKHTPKPGSVSERRALARRKSGELRQRAERAASVAERSIRERPPAPWDPFPLTELFILLGIISLVVGFFVAGQTGKALIAAGVALAVMGGLDTIFREHFNGYRSHAGMLAGMLALLALIGTTALLTIGIAVRAAIGIGVFVTAFPALRRDFIRRSGGRRVL